MELEKRVANLEKLVNSLIDTINNSKFYTDADISGARQSINQVDKKVDDAMGMLIPEWSGSSVDYFAGEKVGYNGKYYKCIQSHTSQQNWTPDSAVSLWAVTSDPAEEWPEWKQPAGAHDAYAKGDKVTHLFRHWISDIDDNVWEPSVYGWTEQ